MNRQGHPAAQRQVPTAADIVVTQRPAGCPVRREEIAGPAIAAMRARSSGSG